MQPFRFPLEKVLNWYRTQYQIEEARLAECAALLNATSQSIAALRAERAATEHELIALATISARELAALEVFRLYSKKRESELQVEWQRLEQTTNDQRLKTLQAQCRVKLLGKLRERAQSTHTYAENRELESLASETYIARWSHR